MKRTMTILLCCLAFATLGFARGGQEKPNPQQPANKPADSKPAEAMPTVDQILDKYVQAIGGKAAIEKINSRVEKGTFDIPAMGMSAPIEIYSKTPNKTVFIVNIPGFGVVQEGYNGTVAWAQDPTSGLREKAGEELAQMKLSSELHRDIKLKSLYPKMELLGKEKVGGRDAYVIQATPAETSPQKMYFDTETGLLVRMDSEAVGPMGKLSISTTLEDYKEVDGVKIPFTVRQDSSAISFTIKLTEVKQNVPIEDAKFNKPSGQ